MEAGGAEGPNLVGGPDRGHPSVEELMPELIRGLAQNHIRDRVPGQTRGILDLLEEDQSRDLRLREHRLRWNQTREIPHTPTSRTNCSSNTHTSVSQQLQQLLTQELNRQIQRHITREIHSQIQDQLQMYVDQELERQITQQMINADAHWGDS